MSIVKRLRICCGPIRRGLPDGYLAMSASSHGSQGAQEKINIPMVDDQPGKLLTYEAILADLAPVYEI